MFAKRNRFSFKRRVPRHVHGAPFFVLRHELTDRPFLECAVVVGKKVSKKAVERNRIKRQLIVILKEELQLDAQIAIIVYARKPILNATLDQLREAVNDSLIATKLK